MQYWQHVSYYPALTRDYNRRQYIPDMEIHLLVHDICKGILVCMKIVNPKQLCAF